MSTDKTTEERARQRWNAGADEYNRWDALDADERAVLIEKERANAVRRKENAEDA